MEPVPDGVLMNDQRDPDIRVRPNTTYLVRMVNMGALASVYVWFEDHDFEVIEIDGVYTMPTRANMLYLASAQRYSILLRTKTTEDRNFAIVAQMDTVGFPQD